MKTNIILIQNELTEKLSKTLNDNKIEIHDIRFIQEDASDRLFNESKFFGMICLSIASGKNVAVVNAQEFMTKKGTLSLANCLTNRIKDANFEDFIFMTIRKLDYKPDNKKKTNINLLFEWTNKSGKIMSEEEFDKYEFTNYTPQKYNNFKVTNGLTCIVSNEKENMKISGHKTCGYNMSLEESNKLLFEYKQHIGQKYEGKNITLTVDGKASGSIIMIPKLGETAHVTINTSIKSSLSGKVIEMFNKNTLEFKLQDIEPTAKLNRDIKIKHENDCLVEITGWYNYIIQSF